MAPAAKARVPKPAAAPTTTAPRSTITLAALRANDETTFNGSVLLVIALVPAVMLIGGHALLMRNRKRRYRRAFS
jgi:hypothetical protein